LHKEAERLRVLPQFRNLEIPSWDDVTVIVQGFGAVGAHFALNLVEGLAETELDALHLPLLAGSSHAAKTLDKVQLPFPCAWIFGHEGQGVAPDLLARCTSVLRIAQPGGEESLNVAAAAAICLYATRCSVGRA
jgi:tRNA G18 (ribose-2'-O)-methylase SpoU